MDLLAMRSNIRNELLGQKIILVHGCENVAGKLRQKLKATAGTNFTKTCTNIIYKPSTLKEKELNEL